MIIIMENIENVDVQREADEVNARREKILSMKENGLILKENNKKRKQ